MRVTAKLRYKVLLSTLSLSKYRDINKVMNGIYRKITKNMVTVVYHKAAGEIRYTEIIITYSGLKATDDADIFTIRRLPDHSGESNSECRTYGTG